ncbi:MAG: hypothetical protein ACK4TB_08885 [Gemmobacter sp.]
MLSLLFEMLLIGQGLIGPDLPRQVEAALAQRGVAARVQVQAIDGAPLARHWLSADDAALNGRALLAAGGVDALILADALPAAGAAEPDAEAVTAARRFHALATGANPAARVFVVAPWPAAAPTGDEAAWRTAVKAGHDAARALADAANADRAEGAPPMAVIPAGPTLAAVAERAGAGQVPGLASAAGLFARDGRLNDRGQYAVAMAIVAAVTGQSPEGLPERLRRFWTARDTVVTPPMAAAIQAAARTLAEAEAARPVAAPVPRAAPALPATAQPAETAAQPVLVPPPAPEIRNPNLAFGLSGVHDWTAAQPFIDVMRTSRTWTGHLPGRFGGWGHDELAAGGWLDPQGWPLGIPPELTHLSALILTDLPTDAAATAGRYRLTWAGRGRISIGGRGRTVREAPGEIWFDFTPGQSPVFIDIHAIDPADPIRDMVVLQEANIPAWEAGEIFHPLWLSRLAGVRLVRFMDWSMVNNSTLATSADRPRPNDYTWTRNGVPIEIQVALANRLGADPWFNIPHLADDALIREYAEIVRNTLDPSLKAHVEFSNEVWNWQFAQAHWAEAQGIARWRQTGRFTEFYAMRTVEMGRIWAEVFGDAAPARLVRVISSQTGWAGLEDAILNAPTWAAEVGPGFVPPWQQADAYAITGYFSANLGSDEKAPIVKRWIEDSQRAAEAAARAAGLTGAAWAEAVERHRYDLALSLAAQELADGSVTGQRADSLDDLLVRTLPYHVGIARRYDLPLLMYEGGTHVVGYGRWVDDPELTAFFVHLNYSAEMGALYRRLIDAWAGMSDAPFMNFGEIYKPGKWGSWGALRHAADDNPRWQALIAAP